MKLISLTLSGFNKKDANFDFESVTEELTVATGTIRGSFQSSMLSVLFGMKKAELDTLKADGKISLVFSDDDDKYVLERSYVANKESVEMTKNGQKVLKKDVANLVATMFGRNKAYIETMGFVTEDIVEEFNKSGISRFLALVENPEMQLADSMSRNKETEDDLEKRLTHLEAYDSENFASKSRYAELEQLIKERDRENEKLIIEAGGMEVVKQKLAEENHLTTRLDELENKASEMRRIEDIIRKSEEAKDILDSESEIIKTETLRPAVEISSDELSRAETRRTDAERQIVKGTESRKKAEAEVLFFAEKLTTLRARLIKIVEEANEGGVSAVEDEINEYYKELDNAAATFAERQKVVEEERSALLVLISNLEEQRREKLYPAAYRKAVIDASVLENKMEKQAVVSKEAERRIAELQKELEKKQFELERLENLVLELEKAGAELMSLIIGNYKTKEEAVNADSVHKNKLYSNHIIVSEQVAEIKAVADKIAKLEAGNDEFAEKRAKLADAKVEVEIHKAKLNHKLTLLGNKYNERIAENLYAQQIESLAYGDRCPICEGYVVRKNSKLRFVKVDDIIADMDKLKKAVAEDDEKIAKILLKLGAYMSAAESSQAYINSLKETLAKKNSVVAALLRETGTETPEALEESLRIAIECSQELNKNIDLYYDLEGRLASVLEARDRVGFQIKKISEVELSRQQGILEDAKSEIRVAVKEYKPLSSYLSEKRGTDLLPDLMLADKELETIDEDLDQARQRLSACEKEKDDIQKTMSVFEGRIITTGDGESISAAGLGAKVIARRLKKISDEIDTVEKQYEDAKVRFVAVKRVLENYVTEKDSAEKEIIRLSARAEFVTPDANLSEARAEIRSRAKAFGLTDTEGLHDFVLSDEQISEYNGILDAYRAELYMVRAKLDELRNLEVDEARAMDIVARRQVIRNEMDDLYTERANVKLHIEMEDRNSHLREDAERDLRVVRRNIRELERVQALVADGKLNVDKLLDMTVSDASKFAFEMSKGAISLKLIKDKLSVIDEFSDGVVVAEEELNNYQKLVRQLALSAALSDTFDAILGSDGSPFVILSADETTPREAQLVAICSKGRNLTLVAAPGINEALLGVI